MAVSKFPRVIHPSNSDLQDRIAETHDCLHQVSARVDSLGDNLDLTNANMSLIARSMGVTLLTGDELRRGVDPKPVSRRIGGLPTWVASLFGSGIIVAGMSAYKVLEPAIVAFAGALHHALMTYH